MTEADVAARRSPRHIRIFLASPGDVLEERRSVRETMQRLERSPLIREDFTIEVVSWDDPDAPVPMLATLTPQHAVSRALPRPSECDITIVILWGRMGTPLEELKPDGTQYLSGTEWEFEDAKRAGRPILLYRRMPPANDSTEAEQQLRSVEKFFAQFKSPSGALTGGVTTYRTVDEFTARLRTDAESLLPALRQPVSAIDRPALAIDAGWMARAASGIRAWRVGKLLLVFVLGLVVTTVAWTAFNAFSTVIKEYDAPSSAYFIRYVFLFIGVVVPVLLLILTWSWLGRDMNSVSHPPS